MKSRTILSYVKGEKTEIERNVKNLFGRMISNETIADLGWASDGAFVSVGTDSGGILIDVMEPNDLGLIALVRIHLGGDGRPVLYLDDLQILRRNHRGHGIGTRLTQRAVRTAVSLGITLLISEIEKGKGNRFDALARLGFNAPLDDEIRRRLPSSLAEARDVADLMVTSAGRLWWRKNGNGGRFVFDLTAGSRCRQILDRRLHHPKFFFQNSQFPGVRGNGITSRILAIPVTN